MTEILLPCFLTLCLNSALDIQGSRVRGKLKTVELLYLPCLWGRRLMNGLRLVSGAVDQEIHRMLQQIGCNYLDSRLM